MTALRVQTGGRHQTSHASLRGHRVDMTRRLYYASEGASDHSQWNESEWSNWTSLGSPRAHLHVVGMLRFIYVLDINQPSLPTPFYSVLVSVLCLYGPFNRILFHKFSRQLSAFSLCSSSLVSALLVLSTVYLFVKVSFSPDIILCGWLGLKHQVSNKLTLPGKRSCVGDLGKHGDDWGRLCVRGLVVGGQSPCL